LGGSLFGVKMALTVLLAGKTQKLLICMGEKMKDYSFTKLLFNEKTFNDIYNKKNK
jgi:hypothetical protein